MTAPLRLVLAAVAGAALVGSAVVLYSARNAPAPTPLAIATIAPKRTVVPTSAPVPARTPQPLQVYVSGAVVNPGVYELPPGARVHDALALAGGALDAADLTRVDLAAPVSDGEQVNVPRTGDPTATATVKPKSTRIVATPTPTGVWLVNVNTATVNDFTQLPGIGKVTAQKLVDYRDQNGPYSNVDDLLKAGLRASELAKIRDRLTVQ